NTTIMPKHKCPFPDCMYETADVTDELTLILISVQSAGTHTAPAATATTNFAAKVERVRRPTHQQNHGRVQPAPAKIKAHMHAISLDHHLYNHLNDHWVQQASEPQPFITLTATIHPDDYTTLGFKPVAPQPKATQLSAMADTGCQSQHERYSTSWPIKSKPGQTLETRQIIYVTNDSDKLFLSQETCKALEMISGNFPTVGEALQQNTETKLNMLSDAAG
ncbi:hypothetical protein QZH41_012738, partial [Actinostola sp. cb2023]